MFNNESFGNWSIEFWEWLLAPVYVVIIILYADYVRKKNSQNPLYKYYMSAILAKVGAGILFACIYIYYYKGGDTIMYYESGWALVNLFFKKPIEFFYVLFGDYSDEKVYYFDSSTGYILGYIYHDSQTFGVVRVLGPILFLSFKSYVIGTILFSWFSFFGIWKLFLMYCEKYPFLSDKFALVILFIPSVLFWGSGILKDTITLSAACWYVYAMNKLFLKRMDLWRSVFIIFCSSFALVLIKPYIFITLLPGSLLWILLERVLHNKKRGFIMIILPVIVVLSLLIGAAILSLFSDKMSKFSPDKIFQTAISTQKDLKQDYYSKNSFDIGEYDESASSIIKLAPLAIISGLFRPFIWECTNIVMIFSGLENLIILFFTVLVFIKIKPRRLANIIIDNPVLLFGLVFSIIFSFALGLTTANFGALVRFKIPALPFFLCSLVILNYFIKYDAKTKVEEKAKVEK